MNALDLLFPVQDKCGFCDRRAYRNGMCKLCLKEMESIKGPICERCGRPLEVSSLCNDCYRRKETFFTCNRSAALYNEKMKEMLSLYKFRGQEELVYSFTRLLESAYKRHYECTYFDCLTYVPIHDTRMKERGFNQSQQLAFHLGLRLKIPVVPLLNRIRSTDKQSKKQREDRLQTLSGAFQIRPHAAVPIRRVLLVDDVYTTGSTVNECARMLVKEGMAVYSLTVAR